MTAVPPAGPREMWEGRYGGTEEYVYGTEPNTFLAAAAGLPPATYCAWPTARAATASTWPSRVIGSRPST